MIWNELEIWVWWRKLLTYQTIQQLLALGGGGDSPFTISSLAIYSSSFLLLFILAYGIATPGGIFMPSIMASLWTTILMTLQTEVLKSHLYYIFCSLPSKSESK
jgi:hypothetical protein